MLFLHRHPSFVAMSETPTPLHVTIHTPWWRRPEILVSLLGFLGFCVLVLVRATQLLEPDDYAYRASITALSQGHILLTNAQYALLNKQLAATGGQGISQWHHLASGRWISEKNPGYPFYAVLFYLVHLLRLTPLFYGALACVGLYHGAKAWLGSWAGAVAVWTYCFSGAALTFAWRDTMPSFTDASLMAAGFGGLLWVFLSTGHSSRRRNLMGLASFVSIESAVFIRYTNIIELIVAVVAVLLLRRLGMLSWRTVLGWMASVVVTGIVILGFNTWAYGSATSTGYSAGEITFSVHSLWPNLHIMPSNLASSMPLFIVALIGLLWIAVRFLRDRVRHVSDRTRTQRDGLVALVLGAGWLGLWFLYLNYTWTAQMGGGHGSGAMGGQTVHLIRFYLPALGLIALLATWCIMQLPRWTKTLPVLALVVAAWFSFNAMASSGAPGMGGEFPGGAPGNGSQNSHHPDFNPGNFSGQPDGPNGRDHGQPPKGFRPPSGGPNDGGPPNGGPSFGGTPPSGGPGLPTTPTTEKISKLAK